MIKARGERLPASGKYRCRPCSAQISPHNVCMPSQLRDRPNEVVRGEPPAVPIGDGAVLPQTIQVHRHVNPSTRKSVGKFRETSAPTFWTHGRSQQGRLAARSALVRPSMHFKPAVSQREMIGKNAVRPPVFQAAQTPHARQRKVRSQLQCAVDPAAARPARRSDIPVRMIVEGDERDCLVRESAQPKRGQVMEITRAKGQKARLGNCGRGFPGKGLDFVAARDKTQARPPVPQIDAWQVAQGFRPGPVQI